jgi:hypothetical protein
MKIFVFLTIFCTFLFAASETSTSGNTPLYEPFLLTLEASGVSGNKFSKFAAVTFTKGSNSFDVEGFYDGGDTWRARFMPDESGTWTYSWSFEGSSGSGSFECTARTNAKNHGHVHRDPAHPRYLVYDDGTPHHFYGGMWLNVLPPNDKYPDGTTPGFGKGHDAERIAYIDTCEKYRHNGGYISIGLWPLNDDKVTFNVEWMQRHDWWMKECLDRGIYIHVSLFNTWARARGTYTTTTSGPSQVFNVWASGDETAKEFYLRYIVARLAGFANVYWELGNEMEHSPNSGSSFASQANAKYIPWIKQYDPYDLPIGLSEGVWTSTNVDIGFLHQTGSLTPASPSGGRPTIMNELVSGAACGQSLWQNDAIRNSGCRLSYRRTFWRMFTYGGCGSSEATHLQLDVPLSSAVLNVMGDQMRCRKFIEDIPVNINEMDRNPSLIVNGPGSKSCRAKVGVAYACYFLGSSSGGTVTLNLPQGGYVVKWYNPSTGQYVSTANLSSQGGNTSFSHPSFSNDIALMVLASGALDTIPPLAPSGLGQQGSTENSISMSWTAPGPASDGDGAASYVIKRGGSVVGETAATGFTDSNLVESTTYSYEVFSKDDMGNLSQTGATGSFSTAADNTPPGLSAVSCSGDPNKVTVVFSEPVEKMSSENPVNYSISPAITVSSALLQTNGTTLVLTTSQAHAENTDYTLTVNNVKDASSAGNQIAANTQKGYKYIAELVITNLNVVGSSSSYVLDTMRAGVQYYTDRAFTIQSTVPSALDGQVMIRTPNEDKANDMGTVFTLTVNMTVTVYIAVDSRGAADANWMDSYTATNMTLSTSDVTLDVLESVAGPGEISFGGNHDAGNTGAGSNYIVVIVPYNGGPVIHRKNSKGEHIIQGINVCPNPFKPATRIMVKGNSRAQNCKVQILDIGGKVINDLSLRNSTVLWHPKGISSGIYIVKLMTPQRIFTKKILLLQ